MKFLGTVYIDILPNNNSQEVEGLMKKFPGLMDWIYSSGESEKCLRELHCKILPGGEKSLKACSELL